MQPGIRVHLYLLRTLWNIYGNARWQQKFQERNTSPCIQWREIVNCLDKTTVYGKRKGSCEANEMTIMHK